MLRPYLLPALVMALAAVSCGGGSEDAASDRKQVQYSGTTLTVNGISFTARGGDFISNSGTIYVFTSSEVTAQAELTRFVESFGLKAGAYEVRGRQPPFSSYAPVTVPAGFESQWAQALNAIPPGATALTFVPSGG